MVSIEVVGVPHPNKRSAERMTCAEDSERSDSDLSSRTADRTGASASGEMHRYPCEVSKQRSSTEHAGTHRGALPGASSCSAAVVDDRTRAATIGRAAIWFFGTVIRTKS